MVMHAYHSPGSEPAPAGSSTEEVSYPLQGSAPSSDATPSVPSELLALYGSLVKLIGQIDQLIGIVTELARNELEETTGHLEVPGA